MSTYTAGPKIDIDGDLSCRPAISHHRGSGCCKKNTRFNAGVFFLIFYTAPNIS